MSRVGRLVLSIPDKTTVEVSGGVITVKGPLGTLTKNYDTKAVDIIVNEGKVSFAKKGDDKFAKAYWGTCASNIKNMIKGVNEKYEKKLILEGVGFKSEVQGNKFKLALGFSHPVEEMIPEGLTVTAEKNNISISGIDKELVGSFAAYIRSLKKPEPYKGKGFRYADEVIRRKQGKKSA